MYVPTNPHEKAMQRALIQYRDPKNYYLVKEALIAAHREDLIGTGPKCLIRAVPPRAGGYSAPPRKGKPEANKGGKPAAGRGAKPKGGRPASGKPEQKKADNRPVSRSAHRGTWTSTKPGKSTRKR